VPTLQEILTTRRVVITAGAGGVGKTTTAAALSVAAAVQGLRVLCLTIDPAKRLAQSLGLATMSAEAQAIDASLFAKAGVPIRGSLTAMMLDTKGTFDDLVRKYSSSPDRAQKLLDSRLYQYVAGSLAGTQEYMAMEKLAAVKGDLAYDLIVLDTPPTSNALDFLDAPRRLTNALDSAAMRWFVEAFEASGKFSLNLVAKGASVVLRGIGKITGGSFLESLSEFIAQLNDLFGGFKKRAEGVENMLRSDDVAFVLVTSPASESLREIEFFAGKLQETGMKPASFVVNRMRPRPNVNTTAIAPGRSHELDQAVQQAVRDAQTMADTDARAVAALTLPAGCGLVGVAETDEVHDLPRLYQLSQVLLAEGNIAIQCHGR
jgi:anion-transporting  ArsA/GET3 family ATPase